MPSPTAPHGHTPPVVGPSGVGPSGVGAPAYARAVAGAGGGIDEMVSAEGRVRPPYAALAQALSRMSGAEIGSIADALSRNYLAAGVTFDVAGEEHPFPLDAIPRIIPAEEWARIEAGTQQRVRALEAFLHDIHTTGRVFDDGVVPRAVVTSSQHFHRVMHGIVPPNGARIQVAGLDLIRTPQGDLRVLEDNLRVPSGVSYVMTNRTSIAAAMPEIMAQVHVRPVASYAQHLLAALRAAAPQGVDDPTVVVLTPGVYNSAYFEHALLARTMGVELVEGRDLECRRGKVYMRTTRGMQQVHVVYRRLDDDFIDPVHFRPDSQLGIPGIVNAIRAGGVSVCNALGNGVGDDKLVYTYVPDLVRYYLGQEPVLDNVDTWRLAEPEARAEVLDRLDELVIKPVDGSGGRGIVMGPMASRAELDAVRARVLADPRGWIAQPLVHLSTSPTLVGDRIVPRHVDLRPFAVHDGTDVWVLPGGLTRVALPEGEMIVNSSRGGGSKDTWVLAPEEGQAPAHQPVPLQPVPAGPTDADPAQADPPRTDPPPRGAPLPPPAQIPWAGPSVHNPQQEQQQQARRHHPQQAQQHRAGAPAGRSPC